MNFNKRKGVWLLSLLTLGGFIAITAGPADAAPASTK